MAMSRCQTEIEVLADGDEALMVLLAASPFLMLWHARIKWDRLRRTLRVYFRVALGG
jgi:hypothetical protein